MSPNWKVDLSELSSMGLAFRFVAMFATVKHPAQQSYQHVEEVLSTKACRVKFGRSSTPAEFAEEWLTTQKYTI